MSAITQRSAIFFGPIVASCLCLCGCIEQSTVVKVKKDGTGVVHVRQHAQNVSVFGASQKAGKDTLPKKDRIDQAVAAMGDGVKLLSASESMNRSGWEGYELVFGFDDVNKLVLPSALTTILDQENSAAATDSASGEESNLAANRSGSGVGDEPTKESLHPNFRFALDEGRLTIRSEGYAKDDDSKKPEVEGAVDPFADEPVGSQISGSLSDAVFLEVAAKLLEEARVGVFVEIEGTVTESNAMHRKQNLVTLAKADVGKILEDKEGAARMKRLSKKSGNQMTRKDAAELDEEIDGIDLDWQEEIVVLFE